MSGTRVHKSIRLLRAGNTISALALIFAIIAIISCVSKPSVAETPQGAPESAEKIVWHTGPRDDSWLAQDKFWTKPDSDQITQPPILAEPRPASLKLVIPLLLAALALLIVLIVISYRKRRPLAVDTYLEVASYGAFHATNLKKLGLTREEIFFELDEHDVANFASIEKVLANKAGALKILGDLSVLRNPRLTQKPTKQSEPELK